MKRQEKTERVIEWLTNHHLESEGGYPHDYATHAGKLFVADLDDGKERVMTKMRVFDLADLPGWYDAAEDYLREEYPQLMPLRWPDDGCFAEWDEAFYETWP